MATPKLWEILTYGPKAWGKAKEREDLATAKELAPTLAELKAVSAQPLPAHQPGDYNVNLPQNTFTPGDQVEYASALKQLGLNEKTIAEGDQKATLLNKINSLGSTEQQINALNSKDVAPVNVSGGLAYNKYDTQNPILQESSAITSLARDRRANAQEQELRNNALQGILENPEIDPLTQATVANKASTFKPQRVKVKRRDGQTVYMDATPQINGGFKYTPANDAQGAPLQVPPTSTGAIEKDAELFSRVLGMDTKKATRLALSLRQHLKTAAPDEAWAKLVSEVSRMQFNRYAKDPKRLYDKVAEIWSVKFPNRPIPAEATLEQRFNPDQPQEQNDSALPGPKDNPGADDHSEVKNRAAAEGYEIIGGWVEGKGFLARDAQGRKGYFY